MIRFIKALSLRICHIQEEKSRKAEPRGWATRWSTLCFPSSPRAPCPPSEYSVAVPLHCLFCPWLPALPAPPSQVSGRVSQQSELPSQLWMAWLRSLGSPGDSKPSSWPHTQRSDHVVSGGAWADLSNDACSEVVKCAEGRGLFRPTQEI